MYIRAKNKFNHGGIIKMDLGESREIKDSLAKRLIELDLVEENRPTYKKMKVKDGSKHKTRNKDS